MLLFSLFFFIFLLAVQRFCRINESASEEESVVQFPIARQRSGSARWLNLHFLVQPVGQEARLIFYLVVEEFNQPSGVEIRRSKTDSTRGTIVTGAI